MTSIYVDSLNHRSAKLSLTTTRIHTCGRLEYPKLWFSTSASCSLWAGWNGCMYLVLCLKQERLENKQSVIGSKNVLFSFSFFHLPFSQSLGILGRDWKSWLARSKWGWRVKEKWGMQLQSSSGEIQVEFPLRRYQMDTINVSFWPNPKMREGVCKSIKRFQYLLETKLFGRKPRQKFNESYCDL